jgi:hypothetical protein
MIEIGKYLEGNGHGLIQVIFPHLLGGTDENQLE